MSLEFPISLVGKKSGGVDLTQDLHRWFEDGDRLDKVTGTVNLAQPRGTATLAPPPNFTGTFDPARDYDQATRFSGINFSAYTVFMVTARKSTSGYRAIWSTDGYNLGDELIESANTRLLTRVSGGYQQTLQLSLNQWNTIVYAKDGNTAKVYIDGVVVSERTGNNPATKHYRVWDCQYTSFAQFGTANRTWGQEDVDAFHNGGSFTKYADL
jgi:hypothetical protein